MNIYLTVGFSPFILSVEDKSQLFEEQTEFISQHQSRFVTGYDVTCTKAIFDEIKDTVGTETAPALILDAAAPIHQGRKNCYIENGSLKLVS